MITNQHLLFSQVRKGCPGPLTSSPSPGSRTTSQFPASVAWLTRCPNIGRCNKPVSSHLSAIVTSSTSTSNSFISNQLLTSSTSQIPSIQLTPLLNQSASLLSRSLLVRGLLRRLSMKSLWSPRSPLQRNESTPPL
jgi:hypothetical protein